MTRIFSGLAMAVFVIGATLLFPPLWYFVLVTIAIAIGAKEYYNLISIKDAPHLPQFGIIGAIGLATVVYYRESEIVIAYLGFLIVAMFAVSLFVNKENPHQTAVNTLAGLFYIGATLSVLPLLRDAIDGAWLVLLVITVNAFADIGAYYTGKSIGKTPLAPTISPNKTVEGFLGGLVSSSFCGAIFAYYLVPSIGISGGLAAGLIGGIAGPLGDLVESALKRSVDAKDSGILIPGHGGILDRIDSLLFTAPCIYAYLILAGSI